jgi:hypothetical protein
VLQYTKLDNLQSNKHSSLLGKFKRYKENQVTLDLLSPAEVRPYLGGVQRGAIYIYKPYTERLD